MINKNLKEQTFVYTIVRTRYTGNAGYYLSLMEFITKILNDALLLIMI